MKKSSVYIILVADDDPDITLCFKAGLEEGTLSNGWRRNAVCVNSPKFLVGWSLVIALEFS